MLEVVFMSFFFKHKTAYEVRISDWSSDVCSSDLQGHVLLDVKSVHRTPTRELARTLGLLPQSPIAPEGITVADLVSRGRHPHQGMFARWTRQDEEAVAQALDATSTADLAERPVDELSGGQRQWVWIAMRSAARRGGKECVSRCRSRWVPDHK